MTPGIRRILKISVIAALIVALAFLTVVGVINREPAPYRRTSDISKAECMLCNDEHFPDFYMSPRNNMAIVYLNSFQTEVIDINPHPVTQQDKWILESYNGSCRIHFSKSPHGTKLLVSVIQDRGTTSCLIEEDAKLDIDAVCTFLCSDCISSMLDNIRPRCDKRWIYPLYLWAWKGKRLSVCHDSHSADGAAPGHHPGGGINPPGAAV